MLRVEILTQAHTPPHPPPPPQSRGYHRHQQTLSKVIFFTVCSVCFLLIYTISISILCLSQEVVSLVESNQQIYDFNK